jgi:hypothetical protein
MADWRAVHHAARKQYVQQKNTIGYGGDTTKLPDMDAVRRLISSLPRGDRNRLALMMFACLPWKGRWQFRAPLLNLGAVRVYLPSGYAQAPTKEQMGNEAQLYIANDTAASHVPATAKPGAAGWLVLHPKDARKDTISLLMGSHQQGMSNASGFRHIPSPKAWVRSSGSTICHFVTTSRGSSRTWFT